MKIAICEDILEEARQLTEMLSRYLKANSLDVDMEVFSSGEEFLSAFEPGKYQIIFMDISMKKGGLTGVKAAKQATAADKDAAVVFVTSSKEYLEEGYNYAVYYITKPYDEARLDLAMGKCRTQIEKFAKTIELIVDRLPIHIRLRDIYSIESIKHDCIFKFAGHEMTAHKMVFESLEEQLGGFPFLRCHRSYIVNLIHIGEMTKTDFIMENGSLAPISRNYMAETRKAFTELFWTRMQRDLM